MTEFTHSNLPVKSVPDVWELAQALLGPNEPLEFGIDFESGRTEKSRVRVISIERLDSDSMWFVRVVGVILEAGIFEWESTASRIVIDCNPGKDGFCSIGDWPDEEGND